MLTSDSCQSNINNRLDVDQVLAPYLFPNAPKRLAEYLVAREQYDLTSAMARNQVCIL